MMNMSIACEVAKCRHHHQTEQYCTLNQVRIEKNSQESYNGTDCANYQLME